MNFRDEYKKEITELSSDETARRIRESVMARLEKSEQSEPTVPEAPVKKKPLPIKRMAIVGGSIAACLVIGFTALAVNNSRFENIFAGSANNADMRPGTAAPGLSGGAGEQSRPQNIAGGGNTNAAEGSSDTEQTNGGSWDNTASDGGTVGGNIGRDPTDHAPESVPPTDSSSTQNDYVLPDFGDDPVLAFEDGGITLTDRHGTKFFPTAGEECDGYGVGDTLTEEDLHEVSEVFTEDGERYITEQKYNRLVLLTDELEVVGIYVIF